MLKLDIIKPVKDPEAIVGTEELFSIGVDPEKSPTKVEMTEGGMLIAIEDLATTTVEEIGIGVEQIQPIVARPSVQCATDMAQDNKPSNTLFIKDEFNIHAYLFSECGETLDTLVHILFQATDQTNVYISYCCPSINMFESLELIGALSSSKAKITLKLSSIETAIDLLLFTLKNISIVIENGLVVMPICECVHGSVANMQTVLDAAKDYQSMIYTSLVDNKILTEQEEVNLMRNGTIFYLSKEELSARLGK